MNRRRGHPLSGGSSCSDHRPKWPFCNFISISIISLVLPGLASSFWQWNDNPAAPRKVRPRVTRPSGPTDVTLHVVSRTELGVAWNPPLHDGGRAVTKYLVEWDTNRLMTRAGVASPSNPYGNAVDGPLVRSEVVSGATQYRIAGLDEGQAYYVRVSAYGDGYSNAVSSQPPYATPAGALPGYLTDVSLALASDSDTPDRLRLAWSAPEVDVNGFEALPAGCAGGASPPSVPDAAEAYRITWDAHPSFSNAQVHDVPAVTGDGSPRHCCPSGSDKGTCHVELGAEVQSFSIGYAQSSVASGGDLFDNGAVRIVYVGPQSKSIRVLPPLDGSTEVQIHPSAELPPNSPIAAGDFIRIWGEVHLISDVAGWPESVSISSGYSSPSAQREESAVVAYFSTPPGSCFDVSGAGNSAESLRSHIALNFDDSPFDESIEVSRSTLTEPFKDGGSGTRLVGYRYHVTFSGQGFSSTVRGPVEDLLISDCGVPFVSDGVDVSSQVSLEVLTEMESGSVVPGEKYYVRVAGVNTNGVGPYVPAVPEVEVPRSQLGLAQNCRVYAVPTASSSLKVKWDGVHPNHGQIPSSYRVDFYDVDAGSISPEVTHVVEDIDESSRYSITKDELIPGRRYIVRIVPMTDLGEGGPSWFSDYSPAGSFHGDPPVNPQDYLERSCHAVPTCEGGLVQCAEVDAENFFIVPRSLPPPPQVELGTYPSVSNKNRFSKDSILVTFESPLEVNANSNGVPTDKFLVEWSTGLGHNEADSLWSSEVAAQYSDVDGENAIGEFLIDSLIMGTQYFVSVSAHSTAGYGVPTNGVPAKPMTRPDPPFEPMLSGLTPDYLEPSHGGDSLSDSAVMGTSLLVSWLPPRVDTSNDRPDLVGDGGDEVSAYLVEWSRISWDNYSPTLFEIDLQTALGAGGSDALGILSGSFRIQVDTSASSEAAVSGSYASAAIPVDVSPGMLRTILENIPNVGEVEIHSPAPLTWRVTFLTELGDIGMALAENDLYDDGMVAGTVGISKVSAGTIPANSAYGSEIVNDMNEAASAGSIHYVIQHLVPGMKVFVRISARNEVGFGPRRKTAPEFSAPALQRPDGPTSLYSEDVPPYLSVHSPTSLKVHIGPPFYDGGSPLTSFLIEWDSSPTFDSSSLGDGSPLGSAQTSALSQVCSSCVTDFDLSTNTFAYSGSELTANLLIPQRKIMVHFDDDNESYTFSVLSATSSTITVSSKHLRVSSLANMRSQDGGLGSDLEILGAVFIIGSLDSGRAYYVRVSSENGEMGTGKSIGTMPLKETPRGFPLPPSTASATIIDKNTIKVSWASDAYLNDPGIQAFKVERFCKSRAARSSSSSFFGEREVVELSTIGLGLVDGTFHLYFGGLLDSFTNIILGTAKAENGLDHVETHVDLSPHLHRGEAILIGDGQYFVHETDLFTSTRLPLSEIYSENDSEEISVVARPKSMPIAFDATAEEVRNALERMPNVNHVEVRREIDDIHDGYQWIMTFVTNVGPQPAFSVDTSNLVGTNPLGFTITRAVPGLSPDDYVATAIQDPSAISFTMGNLFTGKPYYIQVSSVTDKGESLPVYSMPVPAVPGGVPGEIPPPGLRPLNENTLLVSFEAAAGANGAPVEEYVVESSTDPSFSGSSSMTIQLDHKIQRITTRAHTPPWDDSSSFTLSLGDFHGDFTVPVGHGTTVRVQNGDSTLERSTGTTSLSSSVARGDFLSVSGVEFRVCLSDSHPYDDSHLSLCSKDDPLEEAYFHVDNALDIIDELPIFILDTSLGAAKSPSIGDIFLSTVDASGSSKDSRSRIRRGDLIRVGHPESGETFRVSTESGRDFTDRVIPLSSKYDANIPASLSSMSLEHSTHEVQSFYIRSSTDSVILTPSNTLRSGFRIHFKSETTHSTTAGGTNGCLKWDGGANDLKIELEALAGVDSVEVTREDLPSIPGGVGTGVKYFVTFTGLKVRGNIPPLQIVDVGSNGCLDAHLSGGTFGEDIAPIVVEQVETPYVPFYEIQTTTDISYDASSADMKAALEALSQTCSVDVFRRINRHGYSWDITFVETEGSYYSPLLPLSANGANLSADVDPGVTVVSILNAHVPTGSGGTPYFVRVAARNSFGLGPFALSNPRAIEVSPQPPSEPVDVFAEAVSDTEILVQWNPPLEDGGRPITHYKVEYDELSSFTGGQNSGPFGSISKSAGTVGAISDVQSVTVKIDGESLLDNEAYLSGTFSLSFDGQKTGQLAYNASPEEVKTELEELCNIDEVYVTRSIHCSPDPSIGCMRPDGYTWIVTFVSLNHPGDQHQRPTSKLSSSISHKLSVDGSYLFDCSDVSRATCSIGGNSVASVGTVQEVQRISVASSPFSVTIGGETSDIINIGDSISEVEEKLNRYLRNGVGQISVTCAACIGDVMNSGDSILLYFSSFRGDLPPVIVSDPAAIVSEVAKGSSQYVIGRASYWTVIQGLTSIHDWYVRIFAYNGVGEGLPGLVWPSPLRLSALAPQIPENVAIAVKSATSLSVSWDRPSSVGGAQLSSFIVEYDTSPAFATQNGMPLGRLTTSEANADASIAIVSESYPDNSDPILRRRVMIDDANVISKGTIGLGSMLVIDGHLLTVSFINEESCGVTCLTLNEDYTGTNGMKIYSGPKQYNFPITGLVPGTAYFVRVAGVNAKSVGPFAFAGYPFSPTSSTPMDVPAAISWASISAISSDKLRIDYGPPTSSENPYGVSGAPHSKFHIEVATGAHEIQELQISSTTSLQGGAYGLVFAEEKSECIDIGVAAETIEQALESMSTVDGVSVTTSAQSSSLLNYNVTFNGPSVANKDQPLLEIDYSAACTQSLDSSIEIKVRTLQDGAKIFQPDIVSLTTKADTEVSGYIELSVGYQGNYDMIISVGNQPVQFIVEPGSRWVNTMGDDMTSVLHPGETIVIAGEHVEVQAVFADEIELKEYHTRGTNGVAVAGYRMDNYIGSATISSGDNMLTEANGHNLESVLRPGEVIEVITDLGDKEYLTVTSITTSTVFFSPSFLGNAAMTSIHTRKKVIVPANSSSAAMQASVESLRDVGSVEVTREGPNSFEGFSWYITFSSNMGTSSCSLPFWCFTSSTESVAYISVSGLGQEYDGDYIKTTFRDGRPQYELLGKSSYVSYEEDSFEWRLYSGDDSVVSSVASLESTAPLSGWSNGASIALSDSTTPLLLGQNAAAEVSILQANVQQSFKNIVFSADTEVGQREVQEVELLSDENDLGGSFELSIGTIPQKIVIYSEESTEDFTRKLESLSGIGRVSVDFTEPLDKFGRLWLVTYITNSGDVPLLRHHGTSELQGTNVSLDIREKVKGSEGQHYIIVNGLEKGKMYAVRIYAENEAGIGPYTTASQMLGGGIHPMTRSVSFPPGSPSLEAGIVTSSRAEVKFTEPSDNGSEILLYKIEWTTSSTFGALAQANVRVSCSDGSEVLGSFRFIYGYEYLSRFEISAPMDIRSNAAEISQILNTFELLNEIHVSTETDEISELEWAITFLYDVGPVGSISLDTKSLKCQSEQPAVDSAITLTTVGAMPANYGSKEIFTNELLCGSMHLGEFSAMQHLALVASSDAVTSGSYQLVLDGESSQCIPISASDTQMKEAIQGFENVGEVDVIVTAAPNELQFPYEYKITFKGNYAYGDWPALQVNPSHFGTGECDPFVGGMGHRAVILPIRDESLCVNGADNTIAIVADSLNSVGGTFALSYGLDSSAGVSLDASASEMEETLTQLVGSNVRITRHGHNDMGEGIVWAVTYSGSSNKDNQIRVVDRLVTGRNANVNAYPILTIKTYSPTNDMGGDFRIVVDGESTAPLSYQASNMKVLQEMHRLNGIGKVNMLGPVDGNGLSLLEMDALIDDSFTVGGLKAVATVGDLTSMLAQGDPLIVGTCEMEIKSISHKNYDETQSAGLIYESLYPSSPEAAIAGMLGYSILQIEPSDNILSFNTDCSQADGVSETIQAGSVLTTGTGVDHSMIIKSYTADVDAIEIIPQRNWRGTAPRIFFKPPSGLAPQTYTMAGLDEERIIIRASARNSQGFGPPSNFLEISPSSTVPSAPTAVLLF